jgi:hypothetical protein
LHQELLQVPLIISGPSIPRHRVDDIVELRSLFETVLNIADEEFERLGSKPYSIAETLSPTPPIEELVSMDGSDIPEYVSRYKDGARRISNGSRHLVRFPDGTTNWLGSPSSDVDTEKNNLDKELIQILDSECDVFNHGEQSSIDISRSVESRLDDLGYM